MDINYLFMCQLANFIITFMILGLFSIVHLILQTRIQIWFVSSTYHINELNESQSEGNLHLLCHVLHRPDKFVVASKEITD